MLPLGLVFCFANLFLLKSQVALCSLPPLSCLLTIVAQSFKKPVYHIDVSFLKLHIFLSICFNRFPWQWPPWEERLFLGTRTLSTQVYAQYGKCLVKVSSSYISLLTSIRENGQKDVLGISLFCSSLMLCYLVLTVWLVHFTTEVCYFAFNIVLGISVQSPYA